MYLIKELCADCRRFFAAGGIGLDNCGDLSDSFGNLRNGTCFSLDRVGNRMDRFVGLFYQTQCLLQRQRNSAYDLGSARRGLNGIFNQILCGFGCFVRLGCQVAYFVGYNGKALSCLAGTSCLNCGIECQDIRLKRNIFDGRDDIADLLG